jgi:hypothetical protein
MFSIDDWFVVGIVLDLTGAVVLAFGGLVSIGVIRANRGTPMGKLNEGAAKEMVDGKANAEAGLLLIGAGFILQAVGYLSELNGNEVRTGNNRVLVAGGMAVVVIALSLLFWRAYRHWRIPRLEGMTQRDL